MYKLTVEPGNVTNGEEFTAPTLRDMANQLIDWAYQWGRGDMLSADFEPELAAHDPETFEDDDITPRETTEEIVEHLARRIFDRPALFITKS